MTLPDYVYLWLKDNRNNHTAIDELWASLRFLQAAAGCKKGMMVGRVERVLQASDLTAIRIADVAGILCVSERTLRRKLRKQNTSFKALLDAERKKRYLSMRTNGRFTVDEMAEALGFADSKSLYRASRRWNHLNLHGHSDEGRTTVGTSCH